jgi:uncharacterized protein (DUF1499 family)
VLAWGLAALLVLGAGSAAWVRLAPLDPAVWHVDPAVAEERRGVRASPSRVYPGTVAEVAGRIAAAALAEPRTRLLAGDEADGWMTFVQRSRIIGYPDVISVRVTAVAGGTAVTILSRSRFGGYDWGVNRARVERWLAVLSQDG